MKATFGVFLEKIGKSHDSSILFQRFKFLRERHIEDKICRLLSDQKYRFAEYCGEVARFNNLRNEILHARPIDFDSKPDPITVKYRLKRLLEKIIFKALDFYDNDFVYGSIKAKDLDTR